MDQQIKSQQGTVQLPPQSNGMATVGLVLGILGFILSWIPLIGIWIGWILGILAIIFSGIGIARAGQTNMGKVAAIIGLVLGILTIIFKSIPFVNLL